MSGETGPEGRGKVVPELREVGPEAAELLASLHHAAFSGHEPWDMTAFGQILAMPGVVAWLASVSWAGKALPVGFIVSRHVVDEGEILSLGVHPRWRRCGVARRLLAHLVRQAEQAGDTLFLEVRVSNRAAAGLYEALGFRQVAMRPRYYDDGEDARLLRWSPG